MRPSSSRPTPCLVHAVVLLWAGALGASCEGHDSDASVANSPEQTIYQYKNSAGRTVFVNGLSRVPPKHKRRARSVDLSQVSLNRKLGHELDQQVEHEYQRLVKSDYCVDQRTSAAKGWLGQLWASHSPSLLLGGIMLVLVAGSPWIMRHIDPPKWGRFLMWVLPLLAAVAAIAQAAHRTSEAMGRMRRVARLCTPVPQQKASVAQRLDTVHQLRQAMQKAYAKREQALEKLQ